MGQLWGNGPVGQVRVRRDASVARVSRFVRSRRPDVASTDAGSAHPVDGRQAAIGSTLLRCPGSIRPCRYERAGVARSACPSVSSITSAYRANRDSPMWPMASLRGLVKTSEVSMVLAHYNYEAVSCAGSERVGLPLGGSAPLLLFPREPARGRDDAGTHVPRSARSISSQSHRQAANGEHRGPGICADPPCERPSWGGEFRHMAAEDPGESAAGEVAVDDRHDLAKGQ